MQPTRRDFLRLGLGSAPLLAWGTSVPTFLAHSASVLAQDRNPNRDRNVLVALFLGGGNDGLNTIVPTRDPEYRRLRPTIHLAPGTLLRINDRVGFHPSLSGFARLLENRQLAIVQGVGYPNPNRSHFESMIAWHTARLDGDRHTPGWIARWLDARPPRPGRDAGALHLGAPPLPQALTGGRSQIPSVASQDQLRRRLGMPESAAARAQREALDQISAEGQAAPDSLLQFVQRSTVVTYASSARLAEVLGRRDQQAGYPEFPVARRLSLIAQLIKAGLGTTLYYTQLDGFDTHADQLNTHAGLLRELGDSLRAFLDDLTRAGEARRVMVMVFSEFGRRVPTAGNGTDHGAAGPVFLLGPSVRPGLHGQYPNLQDLDNGDLRHAIDFRRVYATILDEWLGGGSQAVLGQRFEHVPVL